MKRHTKTLPEYLCAAAGQIVGLVPVGGGRLDTAGEKENKPYSTLPLWAAASQIVGLVPVGGGGLDTAGEKENMPYSTLPFKSQGLMVKILPFSCHTFL